jgi:hypothetical protein
MGPYKGSDPKREVGGIYMCRLSWCEISYFCSHYFKAFNLILISSLRNDPGDSVPSSLLSIFKKLGRPSRRVGEHYLSDEEMRSAPVHMLINCNEVKPYME